MTRNEKIVKMRRTGQIYSVIGQHFGISKSRVRQIVERDAPELLGRGTSAEVTCPGYSASWIHMGDCVHCGNTQEAHK